LSYDRSGRLSSITDVLGLTSTVTYDASSLVDALTTPYGTTRFAYAGTGNARFVEITDPLGLHEREESLQPAPVPLSDPVAPNMPLFNAYLMYRDSFHWDKHEYAQAGCTPGGRCNYSDARVTHFYHDAANINEEWYQVEAVKEPLETRVWYDYPGQPQTLSNGTYDQPSIIGRIVNGHASQLWQKSYNALGNPTQAIDPVGRTTNLAYAANNIDLLQVQQATPSGAQTTASYTYNSQHRPSTYTDAAGQLTKYAYNKAAQLTQLTLPTGLVWKFTYDSLGRLTRITNPNDKTQASYTYDEFDRVATATDPEGYTLAYAYDAADRVTRITYPDGTTRKYAYNRLDLAAVTDRQGRTTSYAHDADRRLIAVTDPLQNTTRYAYWENGKLRSLTDPKGHVTRWNIDLEGRVGSKQYADGSTIVYGYDDSGRLNSVRDALGQIKSYSYTTDDRLAGIGYSYVLNPTPSVAFAYDPSFPRLAAMADGTGTTNYAYVPVGSHGALQLMSENGPEGAISYAYDALGRVVGRTVSGVAETFQYDGLNRLTGHGDPLGQFALTYLGQTRQITGRIQTSAKLYPAQTAWSCLPNSGDRRLAGIANAGLRQFNYLTKAEDLITQIQESKSRSLLQSWNISYDSDYRLLDANSSRGAKYGYFLDPVGNITKLSEPSSSKTLIYNNVNELTAVGTQPCRYDADGELISDGARTYAWDAENRLVGITYAAAPGKKTAFAYDGLGRRVAITTTVAGKTAATDYLWCGSRICESRYATSAVNRRYYDEGEAIPGLKAFLYYGPDQLGSVRDVHATSPVFSMAQVYDYNP
jgi:YD repeat-containing protein